MLRQLKVLLLTALLMATVKSVFGFAMLGPGTKNTAPPGPDGAWQTELIGYREVPADPYGYVDIGTPRNFGEGYRWNTPYLYYAVDVNFVSFYGSNGVAEIDKTFAILNSLTNVSSYSPTLSEIPTDTRRNNPRASALFLVDLKSEALEIMLEELGLGWGERWTWCLHDRVLATTPCPVGVTYQVIKRNYDPVTLNESSFINGALYSYRIGETCIPPPGGVTVADAYEIPSDALSVPSAIAAHSAGLGDFYTQLTRDDVGGLRYLLRTNTVNFEPVAGATLLSSSGGGGGGDLGGTLETLTTSNLVDLINASLTNSPAQFATLFPNIIVDNSSTAFRLVVSSNFFAYFTNSPYAPSGFEILKTGVTYTTNVQQIYQYAFANVVTNSYYTNSAVTVTTTNVAEDPHAPAGFPATTNISSSTSYQPVVTGDYYVLPNPNCGFTVLSNLLTVVIPHSTTITATNAGTVNNVGGQSFAQTTTTYFTNHILAVSVTSCTTNSGGGTLTNAVTPALREGIERIQFIRVSFDSLIGQTFTPVTTNFSITMITNGATIVQTFRRTVNQPDFVFTATDNDSKAPGGVLTHTLFARSVPNTIQDPDNIPGTIPNTGPGIITAPVTIFFDNLGPVFQNVSPFSMDELSQAAYSNIGSFDGTTNAPIVYPDGTSLQNYENQILMQITPATLPDATVGSVYAAQLGVTGGQAPYTFSLNSTGLPPGLALSSNGLISGTPTTDGVYDFSIQATDAAQRKVSFSYTITVNTAP